MSGQRHAGSAFDKAVNQPNCRFRQHSYDNLLQIWLNNLLSCSIPKIHNQVQLAFLIFSYVVYSVYLFIVIIY